MSVIIYKSYIHIKLCHDNIVIIYIYILVYYLYILSYIILLLLIIPTDYNIMLKNIYFYVLYDSIQYTFIANYTNRL